MLGKARQERRLLWCPAEPGLAGQGGSEGLSSVPGRGTPVCKDMKDRLSSFSYLLAAPVCWTLPREAELIQDIAL